MYKIDQLKEDYMILLPSPHMHIFCDFSDFFFRFKGVLLFSLLIW